MIDTYKRLDRRRNAGEIDGFTLIELLIVIVVLGILAAVVIFALGGITGKSAIAACQADGSTLSTAFAAYKTENATPALTDSDLVGNGVQSWPANFIHYAFGVVAGTLYIEVPGDPTWSTTPSATAPSDATVVAYGGPSNCLGVL